MKNIIIISGVIILYCNAFSEITINEWRSIGGPSVNSNWGAIEYEKATEIITNLKIVALPKYNSIIFNTIVNENNLFVYANTNMKRLNKLKDSNKIMNCLNILSGKYAPYSYEKDEYSESIMIMGAAFRVMFGIHFLEYETCTILKSNEKFKKEWQMFNADYKMHINQTIEYIKGCISFINESKISYNTNEYLKYFDVGITRIVLLLKKTENEILQENKNELLRVIDIKNGNKIFYDIYEIIKQ